MVCSNVFNHLTSCKLSLQDYKILLNFPIRSVRIIPRRRIRKLYFNGVAHSARSDVSRGAVKLKKSLKYKRIKQQ